MEVKSGGYIDTPLRTTPFASLMYNYMFKQDTKFDPKYSVDLVFDPKDKEHLKFMKALKALNTEVGQELLKGITKGKQQYSVKDIFKAQEDSEGNPTGKFILKACTKEKPVVKDAAGNLIPDSVGLKIGNGSTGRAIVSYRASVVTSRKTVGLTVYLSKAQVTEVVEYEANDGLSPVKGGFVADAKDTEEGCPF